MFEGLVADELAHYRAALKEAKTKVSNIYVGCSGGYGIERTLADLRIPLHSNDVNIYSCMIGRYYSGQPVTISVNENFEDYEMVPFISSRMDSDIERLATLLLSDQVIMLLGDDNPFYVRQRAAYADQWDALVDKTVQHIEKSALPLSSFYEGDVMKWIDSIPDKDHAAFFTCPPYVGYEDSYAKRYAMMEEMFRWEPPKYEFIESQQTYIKKIQEFGVWGFGTNVRFSEFKDFLKGMVKQIGRTRDDFFFYSNVGKTHLVAHQHQVAFFSADPLGENDEIGDTLRIVKIGSHVFDALRSQYLNKSINPGAAMYMFAILVDDKLIGSVAFTQQRGGTQPMRVISEPYIYMLSDFAVSGSKYKRLSKLVLYAALSKEMRLILERSMKKRLKSVVTTAFSNKEVSMKYRGLFRLLTKKEADTPGGFEGKNYKLNYGAEAGQWTLEEGLREWKRLYEGVQK